MRTRTLLLLAVVCGLAILVAGGFQLLRVASQPDAPRGATIGETVRVGDMDITVEGFSERAGSVLVDIEIGGVDDPDGAGAFSLVAPPALQPDASAGNHCGATTTRVEPCTLAFRLPGDAGSSRVLTYRRGDEQVRWDLSR